MITDQLYGELAEDEIGKYALRKSNSSVFKDFSLSYKAKFDKWNSLSRIFPHSCLLNSHDLQADSLTYNRNNLKSFQKVVRILAAQKDFLIYRLFENMNHLDDEGVYGVWICEHYQWKCYLINDAIPVDNIGNPCNTVFGEDSESQLWLFLLEKALAISLGGYEELENIEVHKLFHMLTGSNTLTYKDREDP